MCPGALCPASRSIPDRDVNKHAHHPDPNRLENGIHTLNVSVQDVIPSFPPLAHFDCNLGRILLHYVPRRRGERP